MTSIKEKRISKSEYRKNLTDAIADDFINTVLATAMVDAYADWFIKETFNYVVAGKKAYRMYPAHDSNSPKHDEAISDIKFGTWHHMYLKDNNLQYGMPNERWSSTMLSIGVTKASIVNIICDHCINNSKYLEVTKQSGIKRDLKWEGYEE